MLISQVPAFDESNPVMIQLLFVRGMFFEDPLLYETLIQRFE